MMKNLMTFLKDNFIRYKAFVLAVVLLLCAFFVRVYDARFCKQLDTQQLVSRWTKENNFVQLSCFFKEGYLSEGELYPVRSRLMDAIDEASADVEAEGRKTVEAYTRKGSLYLTAKKADISVKAYGVSKDFFLFHPMKLLSGSYFAKEDALNDGIILDELTAWKLFGATDVAGMTVEISGESYVIRGVVRSDEGHFSKQAKETEPVVYLDYALLAKLSGEEYPTIDTYELLMINPVKNFAKNKLIDALGMEESEYVLIDNTHRFDALSRMQRIRNVGTRGMRVDSFVYPYWENRAIGYENIADILFIIEVLLLIYPTAFCVFLLILGGKWLKMKKRLYKDKYKTSFFEKILVQCRQIKFVKKNTKE